MIENTEISIIVSRAKIDQLHAVMATMPQAPAFETVHFFAGGMYCRKIMIPADTTIVSKVHKSEHLFIGCSGELKVSGQGADYTLRSGDVIPSKIGTKRAVYAVTDVVCITVHKTDLTTIDGLEDELIEDDGLSMYDVNNHPKSGVIVDNSKGVLK